MSHFAKVKKAKYNPRSITQKRLENLGRSHTRFGDLSGIVINQKTNTLVSGHQRTTFIRDNKLKTKEVLKPVKDKHGTVAEGRLMVKTENGVVSLPLRIVNWDKKTEKAANIAANAHGGQFDAKKLSKLVGELDQDTFPVEEIGLDILTVKTLGSTVYKDESGKTQIGKEQAPKSFDSPDPKKMEFEHCCPQCKYQW